MANNSNNNVFIYFKGDRERGDEIIEQLEMLGGVNKQNLLGRATRNVYFINPLGIIDTRPISFTSKFFFDNYEEATLRDNTVKSVRPLKERAKRLIEKGKPCILRQMCDRGILKTNLRKDVALKMLPRFSEDDNMRKLRVVDINGDGNLTVILDEYKELEL